MFASAADAPGGEKSPARLDSTISSGARVAEREGGDPKTASSSSSSSSPSAISSASAAARLAAGASSAASVRRSVAQTGLWSESRTSGREP